MPRWSFTGPDLAVINGLGIARDQRAGHTPGRPKEKGEKKRRREQKWRAHFNEFKERSPQSNLQDYSGLWVQMKLPLSGTARLGFIGSIAPTGSWMLDVRCLVAAASLRLTERTPWNVGNVSLPIRK